jgi:DNA-binding response OmpR family regulator
VTSITSFRYQRWNQSSSSSTAVGQEIVRLSTEVEAIATIGVSNALVHMTTSAQSLNAPHTESTLKRESTALHRHHQSQDAVWKSGDLEIDLARWLVRHGATSTPITPKELNVLRTLMEAEGRPVPRTFLWSAESDSKPTSSRSLDAHIWSLRRKIESDPSEPAHLLTITGYGYQLL